MRTHIYRHCSSLAICVNIFEIILVKILDGIHWTTKEKLMLFSVGQNFKSKLFHFRKTLNSETQLFIKFLIFSPLPHVLSFFKRIFFIMDNLALFFTIAIKKMWKTFRNLVITYMKFHLNGILAMCLKCKKLLNLPMKFGFEIWPALKVASMVMFAGWCRSCNRFFWKLNSL